MWKNIVEPGRPQMTIWRMRIACWIPKATDTHSEYVILVAFPLQQWLPKRASALRYMYIGCPVRFADMFIITTNSRMTSVEMEVSVSHSLTVSVLLGL